MVIKYQLSPYPSLMENLLVKITEAQNDTPGAEVYTEEILQDGGGGHPNINTVIANGLDQVVHVVRLYSKDSNQLLHLWVKEPNVDIVNIFDPIRFKIGDGGDNTPGQGTDIYQNDLLKDLEPEDYVVIRNNVGALHPGQHYSLSDPENGEFQLLNGDKFGDTEEFTILIQPDVVQNTVNDSVVAKWFGGFINVAANKDYAAEDLRKLIRFTAEATYTFTEEIGVPVGYGFIFQNFGSGIGTVSFENAPLKWVAATKNTINIPQYCEACFVFDGTNWNVVYLVNSYTFQDDSNDPVQGQILGIGSVAKGNIPHGDNITTVTHNKAIAGDYKVFLSIEGTATTWNRDNECTLAWWHHESDKPNKFYFSIEPRESGGTRNITVNYLIVKN